MLSTLLSLATLADPTPLTSRIEDVTVYPTTALVHRTASAPGAGAFILRGLPQALDAGSVRVRAGRGSVVGVEVRQRIQEAASSDRIKGLQERLQAARRELQAAEDEQKVAATLGEHLASMLKMEQAAQRNDVQTGRPAPDAWNASYEFLAQKLAQNRSAAREAGWKVEDKQRAVKTIEQELGQVQGKGGTPVNDVLVTLEGQGATRVDVEYLVSGTGWKPQYDLRAASDVSKIDLTYRARVWQRTGEDWEAVKLALSTAQPQRGAQGPEAEPVWVSLWVPPPPEALTARRAAHAPADEGLRKLKGLGYTGEDKDAAMEQERRQATFATVESQGLSARFAIPRPETVQSREDATTVLVGQAQIEVTPERWCVPALDTTVWLRARAKNTSPWALLPGAASVFIGQDYLGEALIELVQTGAELKLHLGADPSISVERTRTQDMSEGPGFLGSRASKIDGWRVHLENHGALTARPDGSVDVIVREVLPRPRDEKIEVELTKTQPQPSADERWKKDREEKGFLTWVIALPKAGKVDVTWESAIRYPKDARIVYQ